MNERQRMTIETSGLRQQALELLASLEESQRALRKQLETEQRQDMMRLVAGRSSLEQAIADTRRMIAMLDRTLEDARDAAETVNVVGRILPFATQAAPRHAMSL